MYNTLHISGQSGSVCEDCNELKDSKVEAIAISHSRCYYKAFVLVL